MADYDKNNCIETQLGISYKDNKSFVRVAHVMDNITGKQFIDIRSGCVKNGHNVVKANGIQLELNQVSEVANILANYIGCQIIRG